MRTLAIAGHGNASGKTLFIERVLEAAPGPRAVVKLTTIFRDGQFCPKDQRRRCACSRLRGDHRIIDDLEHLAQPNTDTGRFLAAGADPVLWALAREGAHADAWAEVRARLPADRPLITEGNTAIPIIAPDAIVFVANPAVPASLWKTGWQDLAARSDVVVINESPEALKGGEAAGPEERAASIVALQEAAAGVPRVVARLDEPLGEWAGPLLEDIVAATAPDAA